MGKNNIALATGSGGLAAGIVAIIISIFGVEGGYVNDPNDRGGETNHGITVQVARDAGYQGDMKELPKEVAYNIYAEQYVEKPNYHLVYERSPAVAEKIIDAGVNVGPGRASKWFQTALNSLNRGGQDYPTIAVDGAIGPLTVNAYAGLEAVRGRVKACELVLKLMDAQQATHYMSLTSMRTFTVGWVDHRIGNVSLDKCKVKPDGANK